jgi:hypothetical protein
VRSICASWERGDYSSAEWAHPEIEFIFVDGPDPGRRTGLAGMAEASRDWLTVWEDLRFYVDEYREIDDERALALMRVAGRGKKSRLELEHLRRRGVAV